MKNIQKNILITGASTGIGAACIEFLSKQGFRVFAGVRKHEDAQRIAMQSAGKIVPVIIDVTSSESIENAKQVIAKMTEGKGLAGLVNNAGMAVSGPLEFLSVDSLRQQMEVNVVGQVAVTQAFLFLLRQGKGRVINIGSISGKIAYPFLGPYSASKYALEAITDSLRMELRPWNIPVSILQVGSIATPLWKKSLDEGGRVISQLPEAGKMLYGKVMARMMSLALSRGNVGNPPQLLAETILKALTSAKPRFRYKVGRDAKFRIALKNLLPSRLLDWIIAKAIYTSTAH